MATDKNTIKQWFRNKLKPTQAQFWAWLDSYWHKDEEIPVTKIKGLNNLLGNAVTVESLTALAKRVQTLENAPRKGVQHFSPISLQANELKEWELPENAMLFALEVQGTASLQVGTSESEIGNLGEIESTNRGILQLGLVAVDSIYLQADTNVEITPIIYMK